jgi:hypothetical protein
MFSFSLLCCSAFAFQTPAVTPQTDPQIVRVSYVQGDVRVSRGAEGKKASGSVWEKAEADLPLESGFSLVTGAGRAEIEFEDASTVYLAENSVLAFEELSSTGGVPRTELALLSGTLSLHVETRAAGERFSVRTPTDRVTVKYPDRSFLRVDSYLDAMKLTSMGGTVFRVDYAAPYEMSERASATFRNGKRIFEPRPSDAHDHAAWDQWVLERVAERGGATAAAMKEAGLTEPIPGLADMNGQGTFYPCAPYGTCWQPQKGWTGNGWAGQPTQAETAAIARQTVSVAALQQGGSSQASQPGQPAIKTKFVVQDDFFPCSEMRARSVYAIDAVTGRKRLVWTDVAAGQPLPYDWAVCHTGSWIRDRGHYAWVVGHRPHHHRPCHWVQVGKTVGFVPIHPLDVKGKPPVNLKDGLFHPMDKKGGAIEHLAYNAGQPVKLLEEPPKQFAAEPVQPLARAEAPRLSAHLVAEGSKAAGAPITFDRKSQSFLVARTESGGGKPVVQPISTPAGGRESYAPGRTSGNSVSGGSRPVAASSFSGGGSTSAASHSSPAPSYSAPAVSSSAASAPSAPASTSKSH